MFAQAGTGGSSLVIIMPTIGVILVALITGIFNWLQSRSAGRAKTSAALSAADAESYATALAAKSAAVDSLQERVQILEDQHEDDIRQRDRDHATISDLLDHKEECVEAERAAALIQRELDRRIRELEGKLAGSS